MSPARKPDGRVCSIDGCDRPLFARDWCQRHYYRWWKHGDTSAGGTGNGEPQAAINAALSLDTDDCIEWPYAIDGRGYGELWVEGKKWIASRLICVLAHGKPPTSDHEAAHSCGNPKCINKRHLRWATTSENHQDKKIHGTDNRGERHNMAKLTEGQVREIRSLLGTVPQSKIAKRFGIKQATVSAICRGVSWGWLE